MLCLRWISLKLKKGERMMDCRPPKAYMGELFRTDAKAEGQDVAVGGWECRGGCKPIDARWFAIKLNIENTPWLHCRGEPFKVVASLELLATLYAVLAFLPETGMRRRQRNSDGYCYHRQPWECLRGCTHDDNELPTECSIDGADGAIRQEGVLVIGSMGAASAE